MPRSVTAAPAAAAAPSVRTSVKKAPTIATGAAGRGEPPAAAPPAQQPVSASRPAAPPSTVSPLTTLPEAPDRPAAPVAILSVYVLGSIDRPGLVKLPCFRGRPRLLDAVRETGRMPHGATARLLRDGGGRTIELDALRDSDVADNIMLREGDVIIVSAHTDLMVSATGAVQRTGPFALRHDATAAALLRMAGFRDDALLDQASLIRGGKRIALHGDALYNNREIGPALESGDLLDIPAGLASIAIRGAVRQPGRLDYRQGLRLYDALALCDGWSDLADINSPALLQKPLHPVRTVPGEGAASGNSNGVDIGVSRLRFEPIASTIQRLYTTGDGPNPELAPGAQLRVPEREQVTVMGAAHAPRFLTAAHTLAQVLALGGIVDAESDLEHVFVFGGAGRLHGIVVDARDLSDPRLHKQRQLVRGDIVWVPRKNSVAVCGAVVHPCQLAWPHPASSAGALAAAGGPAPLATSNGILVLRPANGSLTLLDVPANAAQKGSTPAEVAITNATTPTIELRAGDLVIVPFREAPVARSAPAGKDSAITAFSPVLSFLLAPPTR